MLLFALAVGLPDFLLLADLLTDLLGFLSTGGWVLAGDGCLVSLFTVGVPCSSEY